MPRLQVIVNPDGYHSCDERGADFRWTGDELAKRSLINMTDNAISSGWWRAPKSEWLMGRPYQFDPYFYKEAFYSSYVYRASAWMFASNVAANVSEFGFRDTPNETYSADKWMNLGQIPASLGTQPISVNFTNLAAAAGMTFPTGVGVVASTSTAISSGVTPNFQWIRQPEPQDWFLFGFGQFAVLVTDRQVILLRCNDLGFQTWTRLSHWQDTGIPRQSLQKAGAFTNFSSHMQMRQLMVIPVGWNELYLMRSATDEPIIVPTRVAPTLQQKTSGVSPQTVSGPLWVAAYPSQKCLFQAQPMAYRTANHITSGVGTLDEDLSRTWFSTTYEYVPTVAPQVGLDAITHGTGGMVAATSISGGKFFQDGVTGESVTVQAVNHNHAVWTTGVGNFRGAFHVELTPSIGGLLRLFTPNIRAIELKFAPVLTEREGDPVVLTDNQFKPLKFGASFEDPAAKELIVPLKPSAIAELTAAGIDDWENLPVEVWDDTNDDGTADVRRGGFWATAAPSRATLGPNYGDMVLTAKGMLQGRVDRYWHYHHHIAAVNENGLLEHTDAVRAALQQCGVNVDLTAEYEEEEDTADLEIRTLPGGLVEQSGNAGEKKDPAYAPDWDETRLDYAMRVANQWRKWSLYELLTGKIRYRADVEDALIDMGTVPASEATFYYTTAAAAAAGVHAHQTYMPGIERQRQPLKANFIRIIPQESHLPAIIEKDVRSATDPTAENYVGEYIPLRPVMPKFAAAANEYDMARVAILAHWALRRFRLRPVVHSFNAAVAPWQVLPAGVDVGSIVTLEYLGLHRIQSMEVQQYGRDVYVTTFQCRKLPTPDDLSGTVGLSEAFSLGGSTTGAHGGSALTATGTPETVAGHFGNATEFERAGAEYYSTPDSSLLSIGSGESFWLGAWVKLNNNSLAQAIAGKWGASGEYVLYFNGNSTGHFTFYVQDSTGATTYVTSSNFGGALSYSTGVWYFVFVAWDAGPFVPNHGKLWISVGDTSDNSLTDFEFAAHSIGNGGVRDGSNPFRIGADHGTNYLDGDAGPIFFGKNPPAGMEESMTDIRNTLWNNGDGLTYEELTGG